jgi:hypothetical protein
MPINVSRFDERRAAFGATSKFSMITCSRITWDRRFFMECRFIIEVTTRIWANCKNRVLGSKVKCLLSRARVHWDGTKELLGINLDQGEEESNERHIGPFATGNYSHSGSHQARPGM